MARRVANELRALSHMRRAGVIGGDPPRETIKGLRLSAQYGQLASAVMLSAQRHGDKPGLIDELGTLSFSELDARSSALACALRARGLREGDSVGILCRNHRGLIDINFGAGKIGARLLLLNTDFGGPQLRDVCAREGVVLLVHDEEYEELAAPIEPQHGRVLGWAESNPGGLRHARAADRPARRRGPAAAVGARGAGAAHQRHDRNAEGRAAIGRPVARADRSAAVEGALPVATSRRTWRAADVPRARLHADGTGGVARLDGDLRAALQARARARRDPRASARPRSSSCRSCWRGSCRCWRTSPRDGTRARCGSCSARARSSRPSSSAGRRRRSATSSTTSTARPRSPTRRSRRRRICARRPAARARSPFGAIVRLYD